jgi:hypothetical protein
MDFGWHNVNKEIPSDFGYPDCWVIALTATKEVVYTHFTIFQYANLDHHDLSEGWGNSKYFDYVKENRFKITHWSFIPNPPADEDPKDGSMYE